MPLQVRGQADFVKKNNCDAFGSYVKPRGYSAAGFLLDMEIWLHHD
jgi:hypothetical protein